MIDTDRATIAVARLIRMFDLLLTMASREDGDFGMSEFRLIVFDVDRGLCVYARTPNNYGVLIDCGRSGGKNGFSPATYLAKNEAPTLQEWKGKKLAWLIVTHPHDDHVEDIDTVKHLFAPAVLSRHKSYNWPTILNPPDGDPSLNAKSYYQWQQGYSQPITEYPDLGLELKTFSLSPAEAARINDNPQHLLNNSSYVTILTFQPPGVAWKWKVVVAGDNETKGWEALLRKADFCEAVQGADFFVTAHHGHTSGFCADLFRFMGKPLLNITSERAGDESVFEGYRDYARGMTVKKEMRYHMTIRCDGHMIISMRNSPVPDVLTTKQ